MRKQFRRNAGLALPTVVLFIIMMATVGTLMVVVSNRSMKMSNATPTLDGHYYAAESAINRAMVGLVSDVSDFSVSAVQEAAKQAAADIMVAVNVRLLSFPNSGANVPDPADLQSFLVTSFATNAEDFQDKIRNAVHDYISGAIALPNPHSSTLSFLGEDYFWLIEGTDVTSAMDGFNTPGYANLVRVGTGADADKLRVGLAGVTVSDPWYDVANPLNVAGEYEVWKTSIGIKPYITFESYAGTVSGSQAITQDIIVPFDKFDVSFGLNLSGGTLDFNNCPPDGAFFRTDDNNEPTVGDTTKIDGEYTDPTSKKINSVDADIQQLRNDIQEKSNPTNASFNVGSYNWEPNNNHLAKTVEIRDNGDGTKSLLMNGTVRDVAIPTDLVILTDNEGVTLIGDFSGMNINISGGSVFLGSGGSDPKPFISNNSPDNETFICAPYDDITVNVSDGATFNNVSVGTSSGNMSFRSHGEPAGTVYMNAIFAAQRMQDTANEIRASEWSTNQMPQFYVSQTINMKMVGKDSEGNGIDMGGLFAVGSGDTGQLIVENEGARFNGVFAMPSSAGSYVNGDTDLEGKPKFPADMMEVLPGLAVQISSDGCVGECEHKTEIPIPPSQSFDAGSWGVNTDTADVPTSTPSFLTP